MKCLFVVPEFIAGVPIYNIADCTEFVKLELEKAGFAISYFYPNFLFISWDVEDLENTNATPLALEFNSQKDDVDRGMIMNDRENRALAHTKITDAPMPKKSKKKFVLNLQ